MTASDVVVGWVLTGVQIGACAVAGVGLRRRLVPGWRGPWAALAAVTAGVAVLVGVGEVLGSAGVLRRWVLPAALVAVAGLLWPRGAARPVPADPAPVATPRWGPTHIAAFVATAAVAASWVERVVAVYRRGQTDGDSLMYHLVFAARFVQRGWTTGTDPVGPDAWVAFYPANVELIEATLMLPFGSDVLVPLMNLGWLAVALTASWCIGAEVRRGPLGVAMGALACSVPVMVATQSGTARVDIAVVALVLTAVALVLHEPRSTGSCVLAGLALGLGVGTKLGLLPLAGLLLVAVAVVLVRRSGARPALGWSVAALAGGAYWYIRNWVATGSPVPAIDLRVFGVGFAPLPHDRRRLLEGSSIVENLDKPGFWGHIARPVAEQSFGAVLISAGVAVAAMAVVIWAVRERPPGLRHAVVLAGVGGCIAYPFSPYSAPLLDAEVSNPYAVVIVSLNLRYLLPALSVVLCLLPFALDRLGRAADVAAGAVSAAVVYLWFDNMGFDAEWPTTAGDSVRAGVIVAAAAGAALLARVVAARAPGERWSAAGAGVAGVVGAATVASVAVTAWVATGRSGAERHEGLPPGHVALWAAANDLPAEEIALVDDWVQYPLMGPGLDREVDYVGLPAEKGTTEPPRNCTELEAALEGGGYDLVVVQRPLFQGTGTPDHIGCLRDGGRAELVAETGSGAVFRAAPASAS